MATAARDDVLAVFKAHALAYVKTPSAGKQLASALARGDDVAFAAALALAKRGSPAGKDVLLGQLKRLRGRSAMALEWLYPLLEPADFDRVHRQMETEKAERRSYVQKRLLECRRLLSDPKASEIDRRMARREMPYLKWDEESFIDLNGWVLVLGATRHAKARAFCLRCFGSSSEQLRAKAARALAWVYDESLADLLAERLPAEPPRVRAAIIGTMGKSRPGRYVGPLLRLLDEPTLISTKLAWIEAMLSLAPPRALPILRTWSTSPSKDLAAAARRAIAKAPKHRAR